MRTIKAHEEMNTPVKVGDIVRLKGFTNKPIIAVVAMKEEGNNCSECVIDKPRDCFVIMRDHRGITHSASPCCLRPTWMNDKGEMPIFGVFKKLDKVLEDL